MKTPYGTIPPEHSKGAITVKIHLSELTKELLHQLKDISDSHHVLQGDIDNAPISKDAYQEQLTESKSLLEYLNGRLMIYVEHLPLN